MVNLITLSRNLMIGISSFPWRRHGYVAEVLDSNDETVANCCHSASRVQGGTDTEYNNSDFISMAPTLVVELCSALEKAEREIQLLSKRNQELTSLIDESDIGRATKRLMKERDIAEAKIERISNQIKDYQNNVIATSNDIWYQQDVELDEARIEIKRLKKLLTAYET